MSDPQFAVSPDVASPFPPPQPGYGSERPPQFSQLPQDEYDAVPPLSQGQRVADTFFAPSRTFADIRRNRSWWLPYLLLVLFSLVFAGVVHQRVDGDTLAENAIRSNPAQAERMQNVPPEQRAQAMKMSATMVQVVLFSGALSYVIIPAMLALLLWVGFNFILGGSSTYPGMFAVAMYAMLPSLIFYLVVLTTLFVGDLETFNLSNPAATNAGYFLPAGGSAALRSLLTSIDVLSIWEVFLLGLGGAIVARVKKSTGLTTAFVVWALLVLIKAGIAAI